jgi:hypothetical protein
MKPPREHYCIGTNQCHKCGYLMIHHAPSIAIEAEETCAFILCDAFDWTKLETIVGDDIVYYKKLNLEYRNITVKDRQTIATLKARIQELELECNQWKQAQRIQEQLYDTAKATIATLKTENQAMRDALKRNHDHWHYSELYIGNQGLPSKVDCKDCQLIAQYTGVKP